MTHYQQYSHQHQQPLVYQPTLGYATLPPPNSHYTGLGAVPQQNDYYGRPNSALVGPQGYPLTRGVNNTGYPTHLGSGGYPGQNTGGNGAMYYDDSSMHHGQQQVGLAASGYIAPPTLRDWFRSVDTDGSNLIDAHELVNALRKGKINISIDGAARLIALFDTNGVGQINFEQFKDMHPFIDSMTKGFKKRDLSGDGFLQINEVQASLLESGHRVSAECIQMIMMKFDTEKRGMLSFENYVTLSIFITGVKNTFAYYDKEGKNRVMMDFNQFLSACIMTK